ncbi:MAG: isocitrate dehydrogenase, partial [Actinobacteria bacterium]|nr:isocitrate dehydrogenase [Actinomycetota bacterium]
MTINPLKTITVIPGDGIGPEVIGSVKELIAASGVRVEWEEQIAGEQAFQRGISTGVPVETIESIERNRVVLKGPLATPIGHGQKSANVTLRKFFETFANIRPARELPGVPTPFAGRGIDFVVVRENIEDLYAGVEHFQTPNVTQCLKLISRLGCQRISDAAFALAVAEHRKHVTVATKANIMKLTEGMFKSEFELVATRYPEITTSHMLIDNCAHQMVIKPEQLDVIVTSNMNGDIISDLASGLVGGLGFAPSANIGYDIAMFEPVHGTAPDIAGQNKANPTAAILSATMLLRHINEFDAAAKIEQALFATLEENLFTSDIAGDNGLSTSEFTQEIISRLGSISSIPSRAHKPFEMTKIMPENSDQKAGSREKIGVDIFIEAQDNPENLASKIQMIIRETPYTLKMISNRGTQVWPNTGGSATLVD